MATDAGPTVLLAQFVPCTEALGPGRRVGIWVRGCRKRCPGCTSPEWQSFGGAVNVVTWSALLRRVRRARDRYGIEGVSLSGGEPFLQAKALARLARGCRRLGLTVLAWSGYTLDELRDDTAPDGSAELLAELDVLIDGPYRRELTCGDWLRGSRNQRIARLTDRYGDDDLRGPRRVEWLVRPNGTRVIGVADYAAVEAVLRLLGT